MKSLINKENFLLSLILGLGFNFYSCNIFDGPGTSIDKSIVYCDLQNIKQEFDSLYSKGSNHDSSCLSLSRKINILECAIPKDSISLSIADVFHAKGNANVYINYNNARDFFFAALKLRKSFYQDEIHLDLIRIYSNIALSYSWEGNYTEALKYFDSTLVDRKEFEVFPDIYNHTKIGECYRFFGDYSKSVVHLKKALATVKKYLSGEIEKNDLAWNKACLFIGDLMINLAYCYQDMKDYDQAIQYLAEGNIILRQISHPADSSFRLANNFLALAHVHLKQSRQSKDDVQMVAKSKRAMDYYSTAKDYYMSLNDSLNVQSCYRNMGACLFDQGRYNEAIETLLKSFQFNTSKSSLAATNNLIGVHSNLGACHTKLGALNIGLAYFEKALSIVVQKSFDTMALPPISELSKDYSTSLYLLGNLGRVHLLMADQSESHFRKSQAAYDSLNVLLNYIRGNLMSDQAKLLLAEQSRYWIPDAVKDMCSLYLISKDEQFKRKALEMSEQGKSFALIEASRLKNAQNQLPLNLLEKQMELLQLQLKASSDSSALAELEKENVLFLNQLKVEAPAYYTLKYKGSELDLSKIKRECIDSNQAVLEYFVHDSILYIFAITKDEFILDTLNRFKNDLQHLVHQFQINLNPVNAEGLLDQHKLKLFCEASSKLHEILIGQIKRKVKLPERLIIIPDAMLSNVSFDALLNTKENLNADIPELVRSNLFLVQQHSISYCFSIGMLQEMNRPYLGTRRQQQLKLIAPEFNKKSKLLPHMVYQKEEIDRITSVLNSAEVEEEPSKEKFIETGQKHAFIHVSAHGFASHNPDSSFIAFRQNSVDPDSSQFLFLNEMYYSRMNVDLLTLTSCETAVGQLSEGEGNLSFARGFAYAGAKSFITTLWKIQTNGASRIMPGFYDNFFNRGLPKDLALTQSKRDYLNAGKAVYPDNWAGLILVGSTAAFTAEKTDYTVFIFIIALMVLGFVIWKYRLAKNSKGSN